MKMTVTINTQHGNVDIATDVIATVVGASTTEIFGVVGMTSKNAVKDNFRNILGQENYSKGVVIKNTDGMIDVDLYIIVSFGIKITETVKEAQKKVKYMLEKTLSQDIHSVNVFVQGVRVMN